MSNVTKIPARLESAAKRVQRGDDAVAYVKDIYDPINEVYQNEINANVANSLTTLDNRISALGGVDVTVIENAPSSAITMNPDNVFVFRSNISVMIVNLKAPTAPGKAAMYSLIVPCGTTAGSVQLNVESGSGHTILAPGISAGSSVQLTLDDSTINEIQIMFADGTYYTRTINYK